ncbi:MAG: OprD family outer membrane porin [Sulfurovum sp.]|nr:OprD family outer membrane porin [Sulfurovum sp.]
MNKIFFSTMTLMIMSITTYGGGIIVPNETPREDVIKNGDTFLKTVDGYMRLGYQQDDTDKQDLALGGKLHIETNPWNALLAGVSFYTTNSIKKHESAGVPFFDANNQSYSILGEAYIQGTWGNTTLKVGRQELNTPFADTDDVGMVPNTFEAVVLTNRDIADTTLFLAQLQRWSGVDSDEPHTFNKLNGNDGVQVLGLTYEGINNTTLSGWYYHIKDKVKISYLEANYEAEDDTFSYALGAQYSLQDYEDNTKSTIYGLMGSLGFNASGITASIAFNSVEGRASDNFFGGGPYFANAEHHTLSNAGKEGKSILYGVEWDASSVGIDGLVLSAHIDKHTNATEYDMVVSYDYSDTLNLTAIYSDIDDENEAFSNLRVFIHYDF